MISSTNLKIFAILAAVLFFPAAVLASETDGTILPGHQYGWCNQSGWVNFGSTMGNIHVTDAGLTGGAWAANQGWINFAPALGGVLNDGAGNLSGSAWGSQLGWISFANVKIDIQGRFSGAATGTLAGTITFDCAYCDVRTDWRPISARAVCGNGIIETGEQCDGANLGGQTCVSRGFSSGSLSCKADCAFNTAGCTSGGGGGGGATPITAVIFSGRAYPNSAVTILKDGQKAATAPAGTDAKFQITIAGLTGGNYIFAVYSEDSRGNRSAVLTFSISITTGATINITGIFIAPTIAVDKSEVARGDNLAIFGQSAPQAEVLIAVNSFQEFFSRTAADPNGIYLNNFDTSVLEEDAHSAKSRATISNQEVSDFGRSVSFKVGAKNIISPPSSKCPAKADLNDDCRVNLIDFSIAAYWYKRPISDAFKTVELKKLNGDGKIDLVDFSIMAFYWTG